MSIAVLALFAWLVIIVFANVPKGLSLTEMVFLYFIIAILTITQFTILDVNLHWVPVTRSVEGSFAIYICRFIVIPFPILLSVCVLNSHMKAKWRWVLSAAIVIFLCMGDRIYLWAGLITFNRWNEFYSAFMYAASIVLVWLIARWFLGLEKGEFKKT
ncbi:hypothetical protein [Cytobacillus firmus]|uniref:hypothetical protein n=1 Tax=Cytobacillus firmus TaxID=1399 RepID=UPI001C8ED459|nr:hypothetical protein [Cytobacillus firmus]MBX9975914.1 hypothetical protein [Cytobacillus firmus]